MQKPYEKLDPVCGSQKGGYRVTLKWDDLELRVTPSAKPFSKWSERGLQPTSLQSRACLLLSYDSILRPEKLATIQYSAPTKFKEALYST